MGPCLSFLSGVLLTIVCGLVFLSAAKLLMKSPLSFISGNNCGNSTSEAQEKGCQYDVMLGSWLPPACHDRQLMEEYLAEAKWKWYTDSELKNEIPMEILRLGEHGMIYTNSSEHSDHCAYVWMKQFRATLNKKPMDDISAGYKHTHHCVGKVKNPISDSETVYGILRYGRCIAL